MLFDDMAQPCLRLVRRRCRDGEGGFVSVWREGEAFTAAVTRSGGSEEWRFSVRRRTARSVGGREREIVPWLVTTSVELGEGAVFRCVEDGRVFRVVSAGTDVCPPARAGFFFRQYAAEQIDPAALGEAVG